MRRNGHRGWVLLRCGVLFGTWVLAGGCAHSASKQPESSGASAQAASRRVDYASLPFFPSTAVWLQELRDSGAVIIEEIHTGGTGSVVGWYRLRDNTILRVNSDRLERIESSHQVSVADVGRM